MPGLKFNDITDDAHGLAFSFSGRDKQFHFSAEKNGPYFIVVLCSAKRNDGSQLGHHLSFKLAVAACITATTYIHHQHNGKLTFFFIYFYVRMIEPGGYVPLN